VTSFTALQRTELAPLVDINNAGYPAVPIINLSELEELFDLSSVALGVRDDEGNLHGFLMAVDPGSAYDSENYRFFDTQFHNHLYIDRVVLGDTLRGQGVGTKLYEAVFDLARKAGRDRVTCEVNLEPPNPGSLRFHHRMGFVDVGTQTTKGGTVVVHLLHAPLTEIG
jgi:predicted GNAT superfamily acetyltransferase